MKELIELIDRIYNRTLINDKCWEWKGAYNEKTKHGVISYKGKLIYIHRLIFCKLFKLDYYDKSFMVCHICNNPKCWCPLHLYKGNSSTNTVDQVNSNTHHESRRTHCDNGHEFSLENTRYTNGKRVCRTCSKESDKRNYQNNKKRRIELRKQRLLQEIRKSQ